MVCIFHLLIQSIRRSCTASVLSPTSQGVSLAATLASLSLRHTRGSFSTILTNNTVVQQRKVQ
jgi:hypothetical protein